MFVLAHTPFISLPAELPGMFDWFRRFLFGAETFESLKVLPDALKVLQSAYKHRRSPVSELDKEQKRLDGIKMGSLRSQIRNLENMLQDQGGSVESEEETPDLQGFSIESLLSNPAIQENIMTFLQDPKNMQRLKLASKGQKQEKWL